MAGGLAGCAAEAGTTGPRTAGLTTTGAEAAGAAGVIAAVRTMPNKVWSAAGDGALAATGVTYVTARRASATTFFSCRFSAW